MILLAGALALGGCGKPAKNPGEGVPGMMDLPSFKQAFASSTPEQEESANKVAHGVRYGLYPEALADYLKTCP